MCRQLCGSEQGKNILIEQGIVRIRQERHLARRCHFVDFAGIGLCQFPSEAIITKPIWTHWHKDGFDIAKSSLRIRRNQSKG
jgi:hypothetical protein